MVFRLLHLRSHPIQDQLLIEEALLRGNDQNWCIINEGSPPAIVMGISGKKEELIDCDRAARDKIPVIQRFSGGGTVIVDENTLFVTFICEKHLHDFPPYPEPIMRWTAEIYHDALCHPLFRLRENDYVIGDRKFGGNAQYIKKNRWLHHTSFLWDYSPSRMDYLLHPKKTPAYREGRTHLDFLCRMAEYFEDKTEVVNRIIQAIEKRYPLQKTSLEETLEIIAPSSPMQG